MTEYDYSPEAYERYLATQTRIANWVDKTEQHRPQFQPAVPSGPPATPSRPLYDPLSKPKHTPPPSPPHYHPQQHAQPQQRRQLYVHPPPPESESESEGGYGDGPGPMPLPSSGMMFPPQPAYHHPAQPMGRPMLSPPPIMMPQTYVIPPHKSSRRSHRPHSLGSHSRSRSYHSPAYYSMATPPVSPGYQYHYPPVVGGGQQGYFMMQPHRGRQVPIMQTNNSWPPRLVPSNVSPFDVPTLPQAPIGYRPVPGPAMSAPASSSYYPAHSVRSTPPSLGMTSSQQTHYFLDIP